MNKFRLPEAFLVALEAVNIDPPFLFRKSGLPPTLCSSGNGMISTEQNFRLWHTLGEMSDDPAIGLRMATLKLHHPPNMPAQHARTFGDALLDLARSSILFFSEEMRIVKTTNECSIEFTGAMLNEAAPALYLDTAFALTLETGRRGTQQRLHPLRVELTRPVSHQEVYEAHYGCRVRFKARRNVIVFRTGDLELPFATYNAKLLARLRPQLDREIARLKMQQTTSFRTKRVLKRLLGGQDAGIHEVKELGVNNMLSSCCSSVAESLEKTSAMLAACSRKTGTMSLQSANRFQQFIRVAFTAVWTKTGRLWRCRVYCLQYPGQEKLSALDQAKIINRTREIHYDDRLH